MSRVTKIDGIPVIDAKRPLTLFVTTWDISRATRKEPNCCALARACSRQLHVKEARIHLGRIYLRMGDHWVRYLTSQSARAEIIAFDRGGKFSPGEFHLHPVWQSERAGTKRASGPRKTKGVKRSAPRIVRDVRAGPAAA